MFLDNAIEAWETMQKSVCRSGARPGGEFRSGRGSKQRDQLIAIRETLEQQEGGTPNVIAFERFEATHIGHVSKAKMNRNGLTEQLEKDWLN